MEDDNVEVQFKNWLKMLNYLGSVFCIGGYIFMLGLLISEDNAHFLLVTGLLIATIFSILWFINTYQFNINFRANSIEKSGVFNKEIPYATIEKIQFYKDRIEIIGPGFANRVSIGNLNTNFEEAREQLASKIEGIDDIDLKGKPKYIEKHIESTTESNN